MLEKEKNERPTLDCFAYVWVNLPFIFWSSAGWLPENGLTVKKDILQHNMLVIVLNIDTQVFLMSTVQLKELMREFDFNS